MTSEALYTLVDHKRFYSNFILFNLLALVVGLSRPYVGRLSFYIHGELENKHNSIIPML